MGAAEQSSESSDGDDGDGGDNISGDVNWTIQDANTPQGKKVINKDTPLTVKGDKYVKTTVNNDGLNLGLDENQLNNTITNITNNTVAGKGLHFGANSGSDVLNKLDSKVTIQGEGAKADSEYSGKNVKTKISQGADGNTIIDVMLDKELKLVGASPYSSV